MSNEDYDELTIWEAAIYAAPWREATGPDPITHRPTYGPEYLPKSPVTGGPVSYDKAKKEHDEGRYAFSGGLWDHEAGKPPPRRQRPLKEAPEDTDEVNAWMSRHSHRVPRRELEVYTHYWVEGRSKRQVSNLLGISWYAVRDVIRSLRDRVRRGR